MRSRLLHHLTHRRPWHRVALLLIGTIAAPLIAADVGPPDTRASTDVAVRRAAALAYGKRCSSDAGEPRYCGFDYQAPDNACACLMRNGVAVGPVVGWPLDRRWHSFGAGPADGDQARLRWHYLCRQADGVALGYTPFYTGEPGGSYGPQRMREECLRSPKALEWDCQISSHWWTVEEFMDWNMTRFPCSCTGWGWTPPYDCPLSTDPPVPAPVPVPDPTPEPPPPAPTPEPPPPPPGQCRQPDGTRGCLDQVGLCGPCPGSTPAPAPSPPPAPTPEPECPATPCPSCPYTPPCPEPPAPVACPPLPGSAMLTLDVSKAWTLKQQRKDRMTRAIAELRAWAAALKCAAAVP